MEAGPENGKCCSCTLDKSRFLVQHEDPDLFHRSQWDEPGRPSIGYCIYRAVMAAVMIGGVTAHIASTRTTLGAKWLIYMTNQGIAFLTLHYLVYAGIVLGRRLSDYPLPPGSLPFIYSLSWSLQSAFSTVALWITIIYWSVLHAYVVEFGLMTSTWMEVLNVFLHAVNTLSCLIDIFITSRPIRIEHFYLAVIFGIYYTVFSVVYWAAGGVGICRYVTVDGREEYQCDKYIYPILDWDGNPGLAAGTVLGGCLVMPLLQAFWFGLYKLRTKIFISSVERRNLDLRMAQMRSVPSLE